MGRGRGKATPKKNPTPGGRADRKVVLEYSSDETPDENAPQPAEGAEAPKRVKKQIHLTLPTGPAHVTTTETFATFFINHGLTRALQKAFAKKGWSTDQMRECHQLPEETWTASPNAQNLRGRGLHRRRRSRAGRWDQSGQEEDHRQCTWW